MSTYVFNCKIEGLKPEDKTLLEQAGCRFSNGSWEFDLIRKDGESGDDFRQRGRQWLERELARLTVLTASLCEFKDLNATPSPGGITVKLQTAWGHRPQMPDSHVGWGDSSAEFRASAWVVAKKTNDIVLEFVMLDCICESANVTQKWTDRDTYPPRFAEVRILRNLLVHGQNSPRQEVLQYLDRFRTVGSSRYSDRDNHLKLAQSRSAHLQSAVWHIVVNDCVDEDVDIRASEPASQGGLVIVDEGPCPGPLRPLPFER